jgi:hypothetical protein
LKNRKAGRITRPKKVKQKPVEEKVRKIMRLRLRQIQDKAKGRKIVSNENKDMKI